MGFQSDERLPFPLAWALRLNSQNAGKRRTNMNALFLLAQLMPQLTPAPGQLGGNADFFKGEDNQAQAFTQLVEQFSFEPNDKDFSQTSVAVAVEKLKLNHPFFSQDIQADTQSVQNNIYTGQVQSHAPLLAQLLQTISNEEEFPFEWPEASPLPIEKNEELVPAPFDETDKLPVIATADTSEIIEEAAPPVPLVQNATAQARPVEPTQKSIEQLAGGTPEEEDTPALASQNTKQAMPPQKPQNSFGQIVSELAQNKEDGPIEPKTLPQHPAQQNIQPVTTPTSSAVQLVQQLDNQAHQSQPQITKQASNPELAREVGVEIAHMAKAGKRNFSIRLDPPEMGRIDIRMTLGQDAQVKAVMTVEHERTLDVLQRDMRSLERALESAGFKPENMALNLSLKQQGQGQNAHREQDTHHALSADEGEEAEFEEFTPETIAQLTGENRPLDLRI